VASSSPTLQDSMPLPAIKKRAHQQFHKSQHYYYLKQNCSCKKTPKPPNMISRQTPKPMSIFLSQTDLTTIWPRRRSCIESGVVKLHTVNRWKGSYTKIHCRDEHFNPPRCWMKWRSYTGKDFITLLVEPPPSQMV
jgi:hypothetical protein